MAEGVSSVSEEIGESRLKALCAGATLRIRVLETTASTNADVLTILRERGSTEEVVPVAVFAKRQTAGRGRIGRKWESLPGNICVSFGFSPKIRPERMANFTLWMGASICEILERCYNVPTTLKWPNDILIGGKKIAGMLTELHLDAKIVRGVVFGLGLNVAGNLLLMPDDVRVRTTSLSEHCGNVEINEVAATIAIAVEMAAAHFFAGTFRKDFERLWERYDCLRGNAVTAIYGNEEIAGTACGIDEGGSLKIRTACGKEIAFSAGDVTLKKC